MNLNPSGMYVFIIARYPVTNLARSSLSYSTFVDYLGKNPAVSLRVVSSKQPRQMQRFRDRHSAIWV